MKKMSFVLLALLAGLALACASGCKPQTGGIMIPDNPATGGDPGGNNPPDVPDTPDTPNTGGIAVIIPHLFTTQAEKALYEGLDSAEVDQAFAEIAEQTMNVQIGLEGNGLAYAERTATRRADGSYILTIPSLTPGVYALSIYTVTGNNLIGWRRDGILATVRAGQTTDLSIALERVTEIDCSGPMLTLPGTYEVDAEGEWNQAEVWVNLTSGRSVSGIGKTILGTYWFDTWVPVWAFVKSVTVIDDNGDQYELEVSVTDGYSPYGWSIFDQIDSKVASAEYIEGTSEDEGEIDVVVDPIDPGAGPELNPEAFSLQLTASDEIGVGENVTVTITWPTAFGQWMFVRNNFPDFVIESEDQPMPIGGRWSKSINGHFATAGTKQLVVRFFEAPGDSSPIAFREATIDIEDEFCKIEVVVYGNGVVTSDRDLNRVKIGERITLTATPNSPGWYFGRWGTASPVFTDNPLTFPILSSMTTLECYFYEITEPLVTFGFGTIPERLMVSVWIPETMHIQELLTQAIGEIAYIGVAGPNGNWVWDPATSPSNPDVVEITTPNQTRIDLTTSFEPWTPNHFRGTLFAVDVDGNVSFFNLRSWAVRFMWYDNVVIDDGAGGLIIDFFHYPATGT